MRVLVALGGNAMTAPDGGARQQDQVAAITRAMESVADLVAAGADVAVTHGNGPQVGNLLAKNELAAATLPAVTLDWCGAQTQGTIGFSVLNALDDALRARGVARRTAAVVTRTLVRGDDPGFANPTKPVGGYLPESRARELIGRGQSWRDCGPLGWRRVVPSPDPVEVIDAPAVSALADAGFVVVSGGGGGIPVVRDGGRLRGVEAVIDKDLAAALLARTLGADVLVIATDVEHAVLGYGTPDARPLGTVTVSELRRHAEEGHFAGGSMGPKVEATCRFVEGGGTRAVITSLGHITHAARGAAVGTIVVPDQVVSVVPDQVVSTGGRD
ncbi:carbamate kinase [Streptosporangium sp. NPDC051022]|uniref:carbamate kinase n=1 Tax=Streptosporangium sp. NPDC051022 TaxID=3155752 RepID=UPI00341C5786